MSSTSKPIENPNDLFVITFIKRVKKDANTFLTPGPLQQEMRSYAAALALTHDAPLPAVSDNIREHVDGLFLGGLILNGAVTEDHFNGQRQPDFTVKFMTKRMFMLKDQPEHPLHVNYKSLEYKGFCMMLEPTDGRYIDPSTKSSIRLRKQFDRNHALWIGLNTPMSFEEFDQLDETSLLPKKKHRKKTRELVAA